jgi:hypothetical protein
MIVVISLDIEIWEIGKGGNKRMDREGVGGCWVLWPLCLLGYISVVVVEGAYVRD